jgi:hypothetical protein
MDAAVKEGAVVKEDEVEAADGGVLCDNNLYGDIPDDNYDGSSDDDHDNSARDNNDHAGDESEVKVDVAD